MEEVDLAKIEARDKHNKKIARESSWLCDLLQDAGLDKFDKQQMLRSIQTDRKRLTAA